MGVIVNRVGMASLENSGERKLLNDVSVYLLRAKVPDLWVKQLYTRSESAPCGSSVDGV